MKKQKNINIINILVVVLFISFSFSLVFAWNGPVSNPPGGSIPAPINQSTSPQGIGGGPVTGALLKIYGTLSSNGLAVFQNSQIQGDVYLTNFSPSGDMGICTQDVNNLSNVILCDAPPLAYTVTIEKTGVGASSSSISSTPGTPTCTTTSCTITTTGTLTLDAVPGNSYVFNGWSGGGCSGTGTCSVSSTSTVTAQFGPASAPQISTLPVTGNNGTSAISGGNISSNGGSNVTVSGIVWGMSLDPTIQSNIGHDDTGLLTSGTPWTRGMNGLQIGKTYYVRAYATNAVDTGYGLSQMFNTNQIPSVNSLSITPLVTTATFAGEVISGNGSNVTARGAVWGPIPNPTLGTGNYTTDGTGTGNFTSSITSLTQGTTYHVRAYATNSTGTNYGNDMEFTTNINCAGQAKHGYCWYSGGFGQKCSAFCANHGGCLNATLTYNKEKDVSSTLWPGSSVVGSIGPNSSAPSRSSNLVSVQLGGSSTYPDDPVTENTCNVVQNNYWQNACSCNN